MCDAIRMVEDGEALIVLRCDSHEHPNFHKDSIHRLYWPVEEVHVYSRHPSPEPKKWVYEGKPVPATIGGVR